jgi:hypothetical protein
MGRETCVSLAFLKNTIFPLLLTKHVALRTNYSTRNNNPFKHNQVRQTIEMCLFNNLDLWICYDRKIWQREYDL